MILAELDGSIRTLKGVGPAALRAFARIGISVQRDLLLHLPREYQDRLTPVTIAQSMRSASPERTAGPSPGRAVGSTRGREQGRDREQGRAPALSCNTVARVVAHDYVGHGARKTLKVYVEDESAVGALVCFGRNFLATRLTPGTTIRLAAAFSYRYGEPSASIFEFEEQHSPARHFGRILAVYPLTEGLNQGLIRAAIDQVLSTSARHLEEVVPETLRDRRNLPPISSTLRSVHQPASMDAAEQARRNLAYEELLLFQLRLGERTARRARSTRRPAALPRQSMRRATESLPFALTADQQTALEEIVADLERSRPMARLLQGDVGSGKTLVALLSALPQIEAGGQVVLMAPTELLARQHAENAARLLEPLGVRVALLTGSVPERARRPLLDAVAAGDADLVVGTHAVFSDSTRFHDLRYVVVDEQHRFGVVQRAAVLEKGRNPDLLLMTATPIPRTLTLALFGDMETSTLRTLPPGRKPVRTHLARMSNEGKVYATVRHELAAGHQAYFVYPLIDPNDRSELKNAEAMYERLRDEVFPDYRVALVHSRVNEEEKSSRMEDFAANRVQVLVATSVIEVGVDVANATCMVVEHAERFGLAALHQLRGRVGRSELQSYAFLVYADELTEEAKERLKILHATTDGFEIAERDLTLRGPGDLTGLRQSGFLRLRAADLSRDADLLQRARDDAAQLRRDNCELQHYPTLLRAMRALEAREELAP